MGGETGGNGDVGKCAELPPTTTLPPAAPLRCAFYGHCNHEIKPVEEGHRLTLTYILRYDPADEGIARHMADNMGASPGDGGPEIESQVLYNRFDGATLFEGKVGCALSILRGYGG